MQIGSIGIDLGKTTFHLVAPGTRSQVVVRKKVSRPKLLLYTANLPSSLIGMNADVGLHFPGRALGEPGHEVRLIPAECVQPFVKSNKNDYREGIHGLGGLGCYFSRLSSTRMLPERSAMVNTSLSCCTDSAIAYGYSKISLASVYHEYVVHLAFVNRPEVGSPEFWVPSWLMRSVIFCLARTAAMG